MSKIDEALDNLIAASGSKNLKDIKENGEKYNELIKTLAKEMTTEALKGYTENGGTVTIGKWFEYYNTAYRDILINM